MFVNIKITYFENINLLMTTISKHKRILNRKIFFNILYHKSIHVHYAKEKLHLSTKLYEKT